MKQALLLLALSLACRTQSMSEPYDTKTQLEMARIALKQGDFDTAVDIYEEVIAADSEAYAVYPLLSSAYAARAGINLADSLLGQSKGESSSGGSDALVEQLLPSDPSAAQLNDLAKAVDLLKSMPPEERSDAAEESYARGAAFQLTFFESMYSFLLLRQFNESNASTGAPSKEKIEAMTEQEAAVILQSLQSVIANAPDTDAGRALQASGAKKLDAINAAAGDSSKEKIQNYLKAESAAKAQ